MYYYTVQSELLQKTVPMCIRTINVPNSKTLYIILLLMSYSLDAKHCIVSTDVFVLRMWLLERNDVLGMVTIVYKSCPENEGLKKEKSLLPPPKVISGTALRNIKMHVYLLGANVLQVAPYWATAQNLGAILWIFQFYFYSNLWHLYFQAYGSGCLQALCLVNHQCHMTKAWHKKIWQVLQELREPPPPGQVVAGTGSSVSSCCIKLFVLTTVYQIPTLNVCTCGHGVSWVDSQVKRHGFTWRFSWIMLQRCAPSYRQGTLPTHALSWPRSKWVPGRSEGLCVWIL